MESGRIRLGLSSAEGKETVFAQLGPGAVFRELALLDGQPRSADAVAAEAKLRAAARPGGVPARAGGVPRVCDPVLLRALAERLRRDAQLLEEAVFLDVRGRLASVLLRLAEAPAPPAEAPEVLPRGLTQTELARLVGATRESVSKWLGNFERRGLIGREVAGSRYSSRTSLSWGAGTLTLGMAGLPDRER